MKAKADILDYIRSASQDLSNLAEAHQWNMLSYLFRMTKLEAERITPATTIERPLTAPKPVTAGSGYWDWDVSRDRIFGDEQATGYFNIEKDAGRDGTPLSEWQKAVHPDDVDYVAAQIMSSIETGSEYGARFRVIAPDQTIRHVQANGRCLFDPQGRPSRFPGTIRQVPAGAARLSEGDIDIMMKRGQQTH